MHPLVSILIPACNARRWIGCTIESALAQCWPRKEIIIVGDGSSDDTLEIARRFASKDVLVVTQKNGGAASARNRAYSLCQGDYIQWLDADDLLAPGKISRQMAAAGRRAGPRTVMSSAWGTFIHRIHRARFVATPLWCDLAPAEWLVRKFGQNLSMQTGTWLVSRELAEAAGPWDTRLLADDDGEYFSRVVAASDGVAFVPEARIYYRRGFNTLSYIGRCDRKLDAQLLSIQLNVGSLLALEDNDRTRDACLRFLASWSGSFFPERLDLFERLNELAATLGGRIEPPEMSWKYNWIKAAFGWSAAKRAQIRYNGVKTALFTSWDGVLSTLERRLLPAAGSTADVSTE